MQPELIPADFIGSAQVCAEAGIDRSTLSRHVAAGRITPALRLPGISGAMLFDRASVTAYLAALATAKDGAA